MKLGDFNGDGKMDYMWIPVGQGFWNVAYSTGNGFTVVDHAIPANAGGYPSYGYDDRYMKLGDFNGDGKLDYMWSPSITAFMKFWNVAYSTGNGFTVVDHAIPNNVGGFFYIQ